MNIHVGVNEFLDVIVVFIKRIPLDERQKALNSKRRFTGLLFYGSRKIRVGINEKKHTYQSLTLIFSSR